VRFFRVSKACLNRENGDPGKKLLVVVDDGLIRGNVNKA
jgi:hypothetical protein